MVANHAPRTLAGEKFSPRWHGESPEKPNRLAARLNLRTFEYPSQFFEQPLSALHWFQFVKRAIVHDIPGVQRGDGFE
jgi:hypothetical protein